MRNAALLRINNLMRVENCPILNGEKKTPEYHNDPINKTDTVCDTMHRESL